MERKKRVTPAFFTAKLKSIVQSFSLLALLWLGFILALSLFELFLNKNNHGLPENFLSLLSWSWYLGILFWLSWLLVAFLLYLVLALLSLKLANVLFKIFISAFVVVHLLLISYFNTALVMLGADLFSYSGSDILQTVGASGSVNMTSALLLTGMLLLTVWILVLFPKKIKLNFYISFLVVLVSVLFITFWDTNTAARSNFQSEFADNLVVNKSNHFYKACYAHFSPPVYELDIYADNYAMQYKELYGIAEKFEYVDEENFPFLRKKHDADVLSPFFKTGTRKPNVVIIMVEGLGRAFTNEGAYLGNFTPFLDSLSTKSLYWKNFISQGGRTFAVLPSVLGSLPFVKNGFLDLGEKMPNHHSLLNLLSHNGYQTSFYYGGNADFDNMETYLKKNGVDQIRDQKSFPGGYEQLPAFNGFSWGYSDHELYRYYLNSRPADTLQKPQLSVLLTVAMHSPFLINEQNRYVDLFEKRMTTLGFDESKKTTYRNYKNQYASIMYGDEALRSFFEGYQKRDDFSNTIFIITGDHRIPEIPMRSKIDRYHVPLIIYSPMLTRTAAIASISTHNDITPSLLSLLKTKFQIKLPPVVSWRGQGLDTTRSYQNIHKFALMQTKTDMVDFVFGEYHLNGLELFKLDSNLNEEVVDDIAKRDEVLNAFNSIRQKNAALISEGKIIPDSIFIKYTGR